MERAGNTHRSLTSPKPTVPPTASPLAARISDEFFRANETVPPLTPELSARRLLADASAGRAGVSASASASERGRTKEVRHKGVWHMCVGQQQQQQRARARGTVWSPGAGLFYDVCCRAAELRGLAEQSLGAMTFAVRSRVFVNFPVAQGALRDDACRLLINICHLPRS